MRTETKTTVTLNEKEILDKGKTIYDVDKVIEQLESISYYNHVCGGTIISLEEAIDIVKKGGIE
jgi:hypothetical protein